MSLDKTIRESETTGAMAADSLSVGISFMLASNVLQRGIGFLRNLGVCHFLSDEQLGMWALASSFFVLAAPLAVLGLPGSFGRFVESYRQQGQLGIFLKRTLIGSMIGSSVIAALLICLPEFSGWIVFGQSVSLLTMVTLASTLLAVIAFNFLTELLSGLRQPRAVSTMQFINSIVFTIGAFVWLTVSADWRGLSVAFALAAILGAIPGLLTIRKSCQSSQPPIQPLPSRQMWQRVLPFAVAMWTMNLLSNLFDVVDRYMLLHWASNDAQIGQSLVGQYHSGRILPVLLTSLAMMLSGLLLPYMSTDWESGRREKVHRDLRSIFKYTTIGFMILSVGAMTLAPWIFDKLLGGKYSEGLSIMPFALAQCTWGAMALLMQNYLWCREKGLAVGVTMAAGLFVNVILNLWWVPSFGLHGAVIATMISSVLILAATIYVIQRQGCELGFDCLMVATMPLALLGSNLFSAAILAGMIILAGRTTWILSDQEKSHLDAGFIPLLNRLGLRFVSLWPMAASPKRS